MEDQNLAANTAPAEGVATPTPDITPEITSDAQGGQQSDVNQPIQQPETKVEDVTQTQVFARRLKEEVERASQAAAQQARDSWIAEQGYEWQGKQITTEADYKQALREKEIYDSLANQNVPEEYIKVYAEQSTKLSAIEQTLNKLQSEKKQIEDMKNFMNQFPDVKIDDIPKEVWDAHNKGEDLNSAYMRWDYNNLKTKISANNVNATNANNSPGSLTGNGSPNAGYFTVEQVRNMSTEEVYKNLTAIEASQKYWNKQ